jgi:16S rRNA processing protein RimM
VPDERHILIGRVAGVHGIRGGLKLASYAESLTVFAAGCRLLAVAADGTESPLEVLEARPQGRSAVLFVQGVADRDRAAALVGCDLFIDRQVLPELPEGTYYWADLLGVEVFDSAGKHLGAIRSILQTGSNDVYVVGPADREILLPATRSVVRRVDLRSRRMDVTVPNGLEPE